jgi:hypothetical protein
MFLWHLAPELSIEDAAILLAGGDPSEMVDIHHEYHVEWVKKTNQHPGFLPALTVLQGAIRRKELKAQLAYRIAPDLSSYLDRESPDSCRVLSSSELGMLVSNSFNNDAQSPFDSQTVEHSAVLFCEPDWARSLVDYEDLRGWLRSRGVKSGFFFPESEADPDDFLDIAHDHFSAELHLAVTVWRALANQSKFPRGPKAAIEDWIARNPDTWKGDEPLGERAKDRIATLVNWNSRGGAPKTGD